MEHIGLKLLVWGLEMFHVEQCDRTQPCWSRNSELSKIDVGPPIWTTRWGFADHHVPAQPDQTHSPLQGLKWGTKTATASSIEGMGKAVLVPQYLHIAAHHLFGVGGKQASPQVAAEQWC